MIALCSGPCVARQVVLCGPVCALPTLCRLCCCEWFVCGAVLLQPIGRSVDETLRLVQAIQFHAKYGEVSSKGPMRQRIVHVCRTSRI